VLDEVYPTVDAILAQVLALVGEAPAQPPIDVRLALPEGRRLGGTVAGVHGDVLLSTTYSRVAPRHRLTSWVRLLALSAAAPQRPFSAATIGRAGPGPHTVTIARLVPLAAEPELRRALALDHLATLLDVYARGMREPLPLYCDTSAAYAGALASAGDPVAAARDAWTSPWNFAKEDRDPEHELVLGGVRTFGEVAAELPRPDEEGGDWPGEEPGRFGRYARRVWDPLLALEEVTSH
jgi:exodeoxyribonuclease V gamma subunit